MKKICLQCGKMADTGIIMREETYKVKGESVVIKSRIPVCAECGAELWDDELADEAILAAYRIYRERHGLLSPEEIRSMREGYGLSQTNFARILGFGDKTITRYENGTLQDESHNNLLLLCRDAYNFKVLLKKNGERISPSERKKALELCEQSIYRETYAQGPAIPYQIDGYDGYSYRLQTA